MIAKNKVEQVEAWLKNQTHQGRAWFAARCAARSFSGFGFSETDEFLFPFFALLSLTSVTNCPASYFDDLVARAGGLEDRLEKMLYARSGEEHTAFGRALADLNSGALSLWVDNHRAEYSAPMALRHPVMASKDTLADNAWPALWHGETMPDGLAQGWDNLKQRLGQDLETWGFWLSFYNGLLNGTPMDWPLIHKIALALTKEDWDSGPEHVADRIRVIEAEYFSQKLPQAEEIEQDEEDGLFRVNSVFKEPEQLIEDVFRQLDFSIEIALRGGNTSGFDEMCVGFKYLDHTRRNCRDDPNGVHTNLGLARKVIAGNLQKGVYKEEDGLDALLIAIKRHEIQLRGSHPEIREAHDVFVAQQLRELDEEKRLALAKEFRELQDNTKDRLRDEFGLDAETLETDSGPEAQADSVKRSGGRTQEMALRAGELVKKMDGSASWKATGIGLRLSKIAELLAQIF